LDKKDFISLLQEELDGRLSRVESLVAIVEEEEVHERAVALARIILNRKRLEEVSLTRLVEKALLGVSSPPRKRPTVSFSKKASRSILKTVFTAIRDRIVAGDQVRVDPWGVFYPKKSRRHTPECSKRPGAPCGCPVTSVKIGFRSYRQMTKEITCAYRFR